MSYDHIRQLNEVIKQGLGDEPVSKVIAIKLIFDRLMFRHQVGRETAIVVAARMTIELPNDMHIDEPDLLQDLIHNNVDSLMKQVRNMDWMTRDEQNDIFLPEVAHNTSLKVNI